MKKVHIVVIIIFTLSFLLAIPSNAISAKKNKLEPITMLEYDVSTGQTNTKTIFVDKSQYKYSKDYTDKLAVESEESKINVATASTHGDVNNTSYKPGPMIGSLITSSGYGTAFMIAPDVLLTAAHCIYNSNTNSFVGSAMYFPGANGNTNPYGSFGIIYMAVPTSYMSNPVKSNDWAVLRVNTDLTAISGIDTYFRVAASPSQGTLLSLRGYYTTLINGQYYSSPRFSTGEVLSPSILYPGCVRTNLYAENGWSGGPMYITTYQNSHFIYTAVSLCQGYFLSDLYGPKFDSSNLPIFEAELQASLERYN